MVPHLSLQLWVHRKVFCLAILIIFSLTEKKEKQGLFHIDSEEKNTRHYHMIDFCLLNLKLYYQMVTSLSYQTAIYSEKRDQNHAVIILPLACHNHGKQNTGILNECLDRQSDKQCT